MPFIANIQAWFGKLRALLDFLTRPPTAQTDLHERRQARAMAILIVAMTVLTVVFGVDWLFTSHFSPIVQLIVFSSIGLMVGLYFINRRVNYRLAAWVFVVFTIAVAYILVLDDPQEPLALMYQLIAVLIAGVFLSLRMTIIVSAAVIAVTLFLPAFVPLPDAYNRYSAYSQTVVVLVVIAVLSTWYLEQLNGLRRDEVARSEKRYRIISELLSDFACAFDSTSDDPVVEWVTDAVFPATGYTWEELRRVSDWDRMVHPDDVPKLRDQRRRMYAGHPQESVQFRIFHKDGRIVWLTNQLHPEWKDGRVVKVFVAFSNITEQMRLTEEVSEKELLRAQLNKEQDMAESRNKFMSMMSHEFRTPLAVILSTSELLDKYHERLSETRRHELLERIITQVTQLAATMDDLSLLVQMQSGKLQFHPVPNDLAALVQRWVDDIRGSVGANHRFDFAIDGDLTGIAIDERLLTVIVNNLLSNAVKYSEPGTAIAVRLRREGESVTLKIADQGIGIPEADVQNLYQPYFRASNVGTVVGTGLGLRTVKEFIELHEGTITLESTVGVGTTITIEFPARSVAA